MPEVYENAAFFETLGDVTGMLADLWYVDAAKPYLQGLPWNVMYDRIYEVPLGERHPFHVRVSVNDEDWPRVQRQLRGFHDEAVAKAESAAQALAGAASTLTGFDPGSHRETVAQLCRIHDFLARDGHKDLGLLVRYLDDWAGSAADTFADNFFQPLELVHANQCYLLGEMAKAVANAVGIVEAAQDSLMNAVTAASDVLDQQLAQRARGSGGSSGTELLTVTTAAIGLVNTLKYATTPTAAALGLASVGATLVREYGISNVEVEPTTMRASSAEDVAESLQGEVSGVGTWLDGSLSELNGTVGTKRTDMADMQDADRLSAARPTLTAETPRQHFHYQFGDL
jgi:hypothetical protein